MRPYFLNNAHDLAVWLSDGVNARLHRLGLPKDAVRIELFLGDKFALHYYDGERREVSYTVTVEVREEGRGDF